MKKATFLILISISVLFFLNACEKLDKEIKKVSAHSGSSHNTGQDCMGCHEDGSDVEGWFMVAGSVFDATQTNPQPNVNVLLYTGPNGTVKQVENIEVDLNGNFYTTYLVDFEKGLYPAVLGTSGDVKYMQSKAYHGNCNNCHNGSGAPKIWIN